MERPSDVMMVVFPCAPILREPLKRRHIEDARVSIEAPAIAQCWGALRIIIHSRFDVRLTAGAHQRPLSMRAAVWCSAC
jgi:hypothetical protein